MRVLESMLVMICVGWLNIPTTYNHKIMQSVRNEGWMHFLMWTSLPGTHVRMSEVVFLIHFEGFYLFLTPKLDCKTRWFDGLIDFFLRPGLILLQMRGRRKVV